MKLKKDTLNFRFLTSFISLVLIMLIFVGSLISLFVRIYFINNFYSDIQKILNKDFINQYSSLSKSSEDFLSNVISGMEKQKLNLSLNNDRSYIILSPEGNTLYGESFFDNRDIVKNKNFKTAVKGDFQNTRNYFGKSMIFCAPLKYKNTVLGVICITDNMSKVNSIIFSVTILTLICCFLGLVFSVIISFKISKIITKPLKDLTFAAKEMEKGNLDIKINYTKNDEIGLLSNAFNNMSFELKRSLTNLKNEKNKLDAIFSHLTDGVMVFSENGTLYHQNKAAENFLNFKEKDDFADIFPFLKKDFKNLIFLKEKTSYYTFSKNQKSLKLIFACFETREKNLLCIIHDITDEQNYISLQKTFAANASHELKTPLTVVKSYAQSIYEDDDMPFDVKKDFLKTIISETDRMTYIVKDMLTLSKTEKEQALIKTNFNLKNTITSVIKNTEIKALEKNITFDIKEIFDYTVNADENLIYRCIENIISNAIKYSVKNDTVSISMKEKGYNIIVSIKDHGEKIPKEYKDKIFERFFRIDKARSRQTGGTGLGLAISKETAQKHGGNLTLDTSFKEGNCFVLTLPGK